MAHGSGCCVVWLLVGVAQGSGWCVVLLPEWSGVELRVGFQGSIGWSAAEGELWCDDVLGVGVGGAGGAGVDGVAHGST